MPPAPAVGRHEARLSQRAFGGARGGSCSGNSASITFGCSASTPSSSGSSFSLTFSIADAALAP
eukprot:7386425-Prymnesium_polylepis.2